MTKKSDTKKRRKAARDQEIAALRDGRKNRAVTIPDKKKEDDRLKCRLCGKRFY